MIKGPEGHKSPEQYTPLDLDELIKRIDNPFQRNACMNIYADHRLLVDSAPASRGAHQAWIGGYKHHVEQVMNMAIRMYSVMESAGHFNGIPEEEQFTLDVALVVLFLHDIEKPFMYSPEASEATRHMAKPERSAFRLGLAKAYNLELSDQQLGALKLVEGVRDKDYVPGQRADKPLDAFCHICDLYSARVIYNHQDSA